MCSYVSLGSADANISVHLPDLFLHSMSYPVMGLLPSKPMVQRRAMVRSLTSRISTSGGSGGSASDTVWLLERKQRTCVFPSEGARLTQREEANLGLSAG